MLLPLSAERGPRRVREAPLKWRNSTKRKSSISIMDCGSEVFGFVEKYISMLRRRQESAVVTNSGLG